MSILFQIIFDIYQVLQPKNEGTWNSSVYHHPVNHVNIHGSVLQEKEDAIQI